MFVKYNEKEEDNLSIAVGTSSTSSTAGVTGGVRYEAIIISGLACPVRSNSLLTMKFKLDMKRAQRPACPDIPRYMSVNCTAIVEHCLVFPNIGADGHSSSSCHSQ
jgi:hypothetical protein